MIGVGLRQIKHPSWVDEIFNGLDEKEIAYIIKTVIYMNMEKTEGGFKVDKFCRSHANRCDSVFDASHALWIILTACASMSYHIAAKDKELISFWDDEEDETKGQK